MTDSKTFRIISAAVLAASLLISGWISFVNEGTTSIENEVNIDTLDYEPPIDPKEKIEMVSPTDLLESVSVTPSDLPVESEISQEAVPSQEETVKVKLVKIKTVTNLRAEDNIKSDRLLVLKPGIELELLSESKTRYQVKYAGARSGWVAKNCCEVVDKELTSRHVEKFSSGKPIDLKGTKEGDDLDRLLKIYSTMGASVAIIENGKVAYHLEYGYANKAKKVRVSENTKFRIASVSKVATSMLAMGAVDDGKLDLDQNLSDVMGFKFSHPSYPKTSVTMRMLLTHSAGIKDNDNMFDLKIQKVTNNRDFYSTQPGSAFLYTNLGMGLAGAVVEKATDKTISQYAKDKFFDGMGIDAAYNAKYLSDMSLVADCYAGSEIDCSREYLCREQETGGPGQTFHLGQGGLLISSEDLASFFSLLVNGGQYNGTQYLSENAVNELLKVQSVDTKKNFEQCIGIRRSKELMDGREMYFHNGVAYGIFSLMVIDPSDKSGIVVVTSGADTQRRKNTVFGVCDDVMAYCYSDILRK